MKRGLLFAVGLFTIVVLSAQDQFWYRYTFDDLVDELNLQVNRPVERWLKLQPLVRDDYLHYDLVIADEDIELRILVLPDPIEAVWPQIEFTRVLTHIADNSIAAQYEIQQIASDSSDWSMSAGFRPKEWFSQRSTGRIWSHYRHDSALLIVIALYDDEEVWREDYFDFVCW